MLVFVIARELPHALEARTNLIRSLVVSNDILSLQGLSKGDDVGVNRDAARLDLSILSVVIVNLGM